MTSVPLGDLMPIRVPSLDPKKAPNELFTLWSIPSFDTGEPVPSFGHEIGSSKKLIQADDVLLSKIVPHIRRAWTVIPKDENRQIASSEWIIFRDGRFMSDYVRHFLLSDVFHKQFMATVTGVGGSLLRAQPKNVAKILIPLKSLDEQQDIVTALDHAAQVRRRANEARAKARSLIPALFEDMFGDPANNPMGWPMTSVGELLFAATYGTSEKANENGVGLPIIRMGNVLTDGQLNTDNLKHLAIEGSKREKCELLKGDLLFNRTNSKELVGKTGLWDGRFEAVAASYFIRLRLDAELADPVYVWAFFNTGHMKKVLFDTARGAIGQANINAKELKSFKIAKPPLPLQQMFAQKVVEVQAIADALDCAALKAEKLAKALSARVFE
ncbi:restriction endonuclease subunit S [Planktotalea arctica]|uniref:restriction endonuclease subunit S n=1 Tax=Planktotalea arctica TaxID=1481893 RepID=UPI003218E5B7